jgi:hypothetical protein
MSKSARRSSSLLLLGALLALSGCVSTQSVSKHVAKRAAFDLECPEKDIQVVHLQGAAYAGTYGATGCKKRVSYQATCDGFGSTCLLNPGSTTTATAPAAASTDGAAQPAPASADAKVQ